MHSASAIALGRNRLAVYGVGEGYYALERTVLRPYKIEPDLFIDKKFYADATDFMSTKSIHPDNLIQEVGQLSNWVLIVTLGSKQLFENIKLHLETLGIMAKIMWAPHIYDYAIHSPEISKELFKEHYFKTHKSDILKAYSLLSDNESQEVFFDLLKWYVTGEPREVCSRAYREQYLPDMVSIEESIEVYISCGAFDGDSIFKLLPRLRSVNQIFAFEPDLNNYSLLTKNIERNSEILGPINCICIPMGLHHKNGVLQFYSNKGLSSKLSTDGDTMVPVARLDNIFQNLTSAYITVDVEGAELDLIQGASDLIRNNSPLMAISIYHNPSHLWEILLALNSLAKNYSYFIRNYTGFTYETVLYAVPK